MSQVRISSFIRITAACMLTAITGFASQVVEPNLLQPPKEDLYIYTPIPDIAVRPTRMRALRLSELWGDQPLLITLVFTRCSGVCYPFLRSLRAAENSLNESSAYRVLVLSFDGRDTPADLESAAAAVGVIDNDRWVFATASDDDVLALSNSTGFRFRWDEVRQQYDHPAVLLAVNRGRLVRLFAGGRISPRILGGVVRDLKGGFASSYPLPGETLFRCFQYDAASRSYSLDWGVILLIAPSMIAGLAVVITFRSRRSTD